jgi:hypothetical protein
MNENELDKANIGAACFILLSAVVVMILGLILFAKYILI